MPAIKSMPAYSSFHLHLTKQKHPIMFHKCSTMLHKRPGHHAPQAAVTNKPAYCPLTNVATNANKSINNNVHSNCCFHNCCCMCTYVQIAVNMGDHSKHAIIVLPILNMTDSSSAYMY